MVPHVYGGVGIVAGHSSVTKPLFIRSIDREGAAYLVVTAVVAGSALGIYNQGGFGVAHYLAVLTLTVAFGGFILERLNLLGRFSVYFQAIAYSAITLFHMIPAITDFLRRLPARVPFIDLSTYRLIDLSTRSTLLCWRRFISCSWDFML